MKTNNARPMTENQVQPTASGHRWASATTKVSSIPGREGATARGRPPSFALRKPAAVAVATGGGSAPAASKPAPIRRRSSCTARTARKTPMEALAANQDPLQGTTTSAWTCARAGGKTRPRRTGRRRSHPLKGHEIPAALWPSSTGRVGSQEAGHVARQRRELPPEDGWPRPSAGHWATNEPCRWASDEPLRAGRPGRRCGSSTRHAPCSRVRASQIAGQPEPTGPCAVHKQQQGWPPTQR